MLDKIKKALETVTEAHHFSQSDIKKLFCGLAHKHSRSTQEEIAQQCSLLPPSAYPCRQKHTVPQQLQGSRSGTDNPHQERRAFLISSL